MLTSQARRFGDVLVDRHIVTREEVEAGLDRAARTSSPFPEVMEALADIPPGALAAAWAGALSVTYVDFSVTVIHPEAATMLPEDLCRRLRVVPVQEQTDGLLVSFPLPLDPKAVQEVASVLGGNHALAVGVSEDDGIDAGLAAIFGGPEPVGGQAVHAEPAADLYRLFERVIQLGASDLHLAAGQPPLVRIVGELVRMPDEPELSAAKVRDLIYSILTARQLERFEAERELDTSHAMGSKVRFRVNVFIQRNSVGGAFRVIPYEVVPFEQLGVPEVIRSWADLPRGLVLVTGPTGSGKSTTLASLVDIVNRTRQCHIITIEDPVEFVHRPKLALVNQREVGEDTSGFGRALTQAMRQDPDVILVGEMRDLETISTAITAAETGHLVFGTLHTQNAAQTVDRIIDVFPGEQQGQVRIQLANSLVGVSTQQLVPTADGRSRAVACEIMLANTAIRALIRDGKVHQIHNAMASGKRIGMQTMDDSLADLTRRGIVTPEQSLRRAQNPDDLARMLGIQPGPASM